MLMVNHFPFVFLFASFLFHFFHFSTTPREVICARQKLNIGGVVAVAVVVVIADVIIIIIVIIINFIIIIIIIIIVTYKLYVEQFTLNGVKRAKIM